MNILPVHYPVAGLCQFQADLSRYRITLRRFLRKNGVRLNNMNDLTTEELENLVSNIHKN